VEEEQSMLERRSTPEDKMIAKKKELTVRSRVDVDDGFPMPGRRDRQTRLVS